MLKALATGVVDAVQVVYNIFDQAPEDVLFPPAGPGASRVIARVPFDEGTLTGTLTRDSRWPEGDWRNIYFSPANLAASVDRAAALRPARARRVDHARPGAALHPGRVPTSSTVIPGMRKTRHVEANLAASDRGPLPPPLRHGPACASLGSHRPALALGAAQLYPLACPRRPVRCD